MAEEEGATPVVTEPAPEQAQPRNEEQPLGDAGEKALDAFKQRARDAERRAKELETKVSEFEDRDKSETEKLSSKVGSLTNESKAAKAENLRLRVGLEKQLPVELIDRLKGSTEEELEADADELLKLVKKDEETSFDGGAREPAPENVTPEDGLQRTVLGAINRARQQNP